MNGTPLRGERPDRLKRCLLYGLLIFFAGTAQCGFFATLSFLPATPDLVLGCLCAIALLDSPRVAMVAAIPAGFFLDAIGGVGLALLPLVYFLTVSILGVWAQKLLPRFLSYVVLLLPAGLLRVLFTLAESLLFGGMPPIGRFLISSLWDILWTWILCLPLYGLTRLVRIPLVKKSRFNF